MSLYRLNAEDEWLLVYPDNEEAEHTISLHLAPRKLFSYFIYFTYRGLGHRFKVNIKLGRRNETRLIIFD